MRKIRLLWLHVPLLWLMFGLALFSLDSLGPTFDEQGFLVRGLGYMRDGNHHMRVGHPLGLNALNAALLLGDDHVHLPTDHPSWAGTDFHRPAELFLWEIGNNVEHVMFLGRLPTIWLGLLLVALASRWARQLAGGGAGLLALALLALDPNILAHTRLATTDLGLAAGALVAGYTLWWYWQRPLPSRAILAGIGFALLQNTKFTAGLFVPLFAFIILVNLRIRSTEHGIRDTLRTLIMLVIAYVLIAPLTLWAMYGFQIGALPDNLPTLPQLGGVTLPLSHHLEQLLDIGGRLQKATPAFLMGNYSDNGWWYYFPVVFLLKTSLPTLILLALAVFLFLRFTIYDLRLKRSTQMQISTQSANPNPQTAIFLLIPALGYFAFALTTDINLGYRHLLPILPFLYVFIAANLANLQFTIRNSQFLIFPLLWLLAIALWIHPHYLAFFNALAGGPDGGWRYLVDSNLDWGQDLGNLKEWMGENGVNRVWLSYFGEGRPEYYGISYSGLDSWPPRLMDPEARPFYPHDPAPGNYAISATNLQGVHFADHDQFAWFRQQEPRAKIGYSIFIYDVPERGELVELALGSVQVDALIPADFSRFQSNQVRPYWFDATTSLLLPESDNRWLALPVSPGLADEMGWTNNWELAAETAVYRLYRLPPVDESGLSPRVEFLHEGGTIGLHHWVVEETAVPGQSLTLLTDWHKTSTAAPLKIFIHVINGAGEIVAQWDGLGAKWQGWRPQSRLWQRHVIPLPANLPPGQYDLRLGVYEPENGRRLLTPTAQDFISLGQLTIDN